MVSDAVAAAACGTAGRAGGLAQGQDMGERVRGRAMGERLGVERKARTWVGWLAQSPTLTHLQEGAPADPDEVNPWANVVVMWGNLLYEASQMRAAVGRPWRPALDAAVAKFRAAGCPEPDIRQALANHTQAEHLELPPLEARPGPNTALPLGGHAQAPRAGCAQKGEAEVAGGGRAGACAESRPWTRGVYAVNAAERSACVSAAWQQERLACRPTPRPGLRAGAQEEGRERGRRAAGARHAGGRLRRRPRRRPAELRQVGAVCGCGGGAGCSSHPAYYLACGRCPCCGCMVGRGTLRPMERQRCEHAQQFDARAPVRQQRGTAANAAREAVRAVTGCDSGARTAPALASEAARAAAPRLQSRCISSTALNCSGVRP